MADETGLYYPYQQDDYQQYYQQQYYPYLHYYPSHHYHQYQPFSHHYYPQAVHPYHHMQALYHPHVYTMSTLYFPSTAQPSRATPPVAAAKHSGLRLPFSATKGRFRLHSVRDAASKFKRCKVRSKLAANNFVDFIRFDVGNMVMVPGGRNRGCVGVIRNRAKHKGSTANHSHEDLKLLDSEAEPEFKTQTQDYDYVLNRSQLQSQELSESEQELNDCKISQSELNKAGEIEFARKVFDVMTEKGSAMSKQQVNASVIKHDVAAAEVFTSMVKERMEFEKGDCLYEWFRVKKNGAKDKLVDGEFLDLSIEDVGAYLAVYWLPTREDGKSGKPLISIFESPVVPAFPVVSNVHVKELSSYTYYGEGEYFGGYEGSSLFSWYREIDDRTINLINGANSRTYEVTNEYYTCCLLFGYTPVRSDSTIGELRLSEPTHVILFELPQIEMLALTGKAIEGDVLSAVEVIPKSESQQHIWTTYKKDVTYQWFSSNETGEDSAFEPFPSHRSCSYKVGFDDIGRYLRCECIVTDVFGRSSKPVYAETSPVLPLVKMSSMSSWSKVDILKFASGIDSNTIHLIGKAIVEAAQAINCPISKVADGRFREVKPELEKCICLTDDKYENHEDRVLRTGGSLILKMDVENLWDTALSKMCSVLEDQFSRMQTANHLLLIKDYVSLLGVTLRRYGYPIDALLDVLSKHRDKYHELLLSNCRKQMTEALSVDKLEQMYMKKEYEYSMIVLSFQIQTSNIMPAFPYVAPFSSMVPDCCRIVRPLIKDSVSYTSHGGQLDFYDVVKKYLDRLLSDVLDEIQSSLLQRAILFHDSYIVEVNLFGIDSILRKYGQGYPNLNFEDKVLSKGKGNVMIQVVMDYSTYDNGQSKPQSPQSPSQVNKQFNPSEEYRIGIG